MMVQMKEATLPCDEEAAILCDHRYAMCIRLCLYKRQETSVKFHRIDGETRPKIFP